MKVLLSWLKEFVEISTPPAELANLLTMSGTEVGSIEEVGANWSNIWIGQVKEIKQHPAADKLFVVEVDLGNRSVTLVTAATNLKVGYKVPVVLSGGSLRPGTVIESVDFRGVRSDGMLCSGIELGISPDSVGIYVMEEEAPVGVELKDYLSDYVFELELTPNRPDELSIVGIAREIAALTGERLRVPATLIPSSGFKSADFITVEIKDPDLCPRYSAIVIKGVEVKPSPLWMQRRLYLCGMRPISNIVDITNYVMWERGQPLHAFDGSKLHGGIIVRRAQPGEVFTTLDGEVRQLNENMLVIADHQEAVAVAGVMGGLDSEVDDSTTTVVLESANFNRTSIRRTSQALRLSTEASKRFEKGLDPEWTVPAALKAASLMAELGGGAVGEGVVDVYPRPVEPRVIAISEGEIEGLLGQHFSLAEMQEILTPLGFQTEVANGRLEVAVPSFRRDVEGRADLAEELARIKGYDLIPTTLPTGAIPDEIPDPYRHWEGVARNVLTGCGFQEVITYSLVDCGANERITVDQGPGVVIVPQEMIPLANPMTPEQACLRTNLIGSLLKTTASNLRHESRIYIFELGRVYLPPLNPLPTERRTLGIALTGPREPLSWNAQPENGDFFDLKGALELLLRSMGINNAVFEPARHGSMHPGRTARIRINDEIVGYIGEVHPTIVDRYDMAPHKLYIGEIDFESLVSAASEDRAYQPLPKYPAVSHDIAVILDEQIPQAEVYEVIRETGQPLLDGVELFDLYQGAAIPPGKKSLAYSLSYRAPDRTLTDEEVMEVEQRIVEALASRFGAYLRGK
ncbi:MAG: phenylalanine--tRNA ligase subunit beta [Chloroflexota bacterium]|jgi:phenylalanyl-tRNA synthetase beta chain